MKKITLILTILFATVTTFATEPPAKKVKTTTCRACAVVHGDNVRLTQYSVSEYSAPEAIVWVQNYPGSPWLAHSSYLNKVCKVDQTLNLDGVDCASIYFTVSGGVYNGQVWEITVPCAKLTKQ